jgi:periplasmic divalent cation tolerance protein
MDQPILVYITASSEPEATRIADALVSEQLAVCVNILPGVRSVYRWQGTIERADETVQIVKTVQSAFAAIEARVRDLHSYEVPCVVALQIQDGSPAYLDWIRKLGG